MDKALHRRCDRSYRGSLWRPHLQSIFPRFLFLIFGSRHISREHAMINLCHTQTLGRRINPRNQTHARSPVCAIAQRHHCRRTVSFFSDRVHMFTYMYAHAYVWGCALQLYSNPAHTEVLQAQTSPAFKIFNCRVHHNM